ncbi:MAG: MarC family protein [Candidatus Altiarchaeota archaeon]
MVDLTFLVQAFVALFVIVEPIGTVPIFMSLMGRFRQKHRARMIRQSVVVACAVLLMFTFFGNLIFEYLGISMYSFKIAGGILLLIISVEMLFGSKTRTEVSKDMAEEAENITISPMAVPLLTGPGAITTGIMLFNSAKAPGDKAGLFLVALLVYGLTYLILRNMNLVYRTIGRAGTKVAGRLMGLMLSAISIQFIIAGIREAFPAVMG